MTDSSPVTIICKAAQAYFTFNIRIVPLSYGWDITYISIIGAIKLEYIIIYWNIKTKLIACRRALLFILFAKVIACYAIEKREIR